MTDVTADYTQAVGTEAFDSSKISGISFEEAFGFSYKTCKDLYEVMEKARLSMGFDADYETASELVGAVALSKKRAKSYSDIRWTIDAFDDETAVIHLFVVDPEYQGKGIATAALDELIRIAKETKKKAVRLDAIGTNKPAQKLYEKYGFINCGKAMEYYESTGKTEFVYYEYIV